MKMLLFAFSVMLLSSSMSFAQSSIYPKSQDKPVRTFLCNDDEIFQFQLLEDDETAIFFGPIEGERQTAKVVVLFITDSTFAFDGSEFVIVGEWLPAERHHSIRAFDANGLAHRTCVEVTADDSSNSFSTL